MELWHLWIGLMQELLARLADLWGLGVAVILMTLIVRTALLPVTWTLAARAARRQAVLARLGPELAAIRARYADPHTRAQKSLELYQRHGLSPVDGRSLAGAMLQLPVVWALYEALRERTTTAAAGFLWVRSLGRPDVGLAILAALTTMLAMALAPHMSEQARLALILLPAIVCFIAALHFSSGVALYWITSNVFGSVQAAVLRKVLQTEQRPVPPVGRG